MDTEQIQYLPLDRITAEVQVREQFELAALEGLAESLKAVGQLQPIRCRPSGDKFVIVDGERRYRAARMASMTTIAAIIEGKNLCEGEVLQKQLISAVQREDLAPLEKSKAISRLMAVTGWNASQTAGKLGMSNATVTRLLALLDLPDDLQQCVADGRIAPSSAYELSRITDTGQQSELARRLVSGRLTRDGLAGACKAARQKPDAKTSATPNRATALLGTGRSVTVAGPGLTLELFIAALEDALARARRVRTSGAELGTYLAMCRDQSRTT